MVEYISRKQVAKTRRADDDLSDRATSQERETIDQSDAQALAARVVGYIAGVLLALLALRFLLALLGANPSNAFADLIYTLSYPFVAPFFGLFNYDVHYGTAHFETYTLFAMVVYALVAYGITRLLTINRPATSAY